MISNLAEILEVNTEKFGSHIAYKCGSKQLSYKEISDKTSQLACNLWKLGIKQGDRVGIYLERSLETAISIYGILKAGAVFVPLDPSAPQSRTLYLIKDCDIKCLISSKIQKKKIVKFLEEDICLTSIIGPSIETKINNVTWEDVYKIPIENYNKVEIDENHLAYIMYTSGSTGVPKGIMHSHKSGLSYARLSSELYQVTSNDVFANHAPLHFDISTFGYFTAPYSGAKTVIIQDAQIVFPTSVTNLLINEKVSIWYSVPLALIQLLQSGGIKNKEIFSLRWVLFGGEVFVNKYLKELVKLWSHANFSNVYGPAEVNQCSYYNFNALKGLKDPLPIGSIWNETDYLILDEANNSNEAKMGELLISSPTKMMGYWNNNSLTEKSLFTNKENGKTYFKTGDLVKKDDSGTLLFLGRNDFQIKIRGYRVEVNEVESWLANHDEVMEAAIFKITKEDLSEELAAAVMLKVGSNIDESFLITYCNSKLPVYAVPQHIYIVNDFPRTSSGKISRNELKSLLTANYDYK